ncbi:hypothetical protein E2R25_00690 [Burkholderia pseudomallei]|nr:hypothetical protein EXY28_00630 [Burkholderia pseudomallei]QBP47046.1 hypothetical protein E2R28_00690 [Burkholderia pseudomallei]QBP66961.1 hypothetical protein E2R25_00690 [Burkholderia pseudomallei]QBR22428.1 hypothetical protein E3O37_00690 [Burkholderia pseudomallei]
MRIVLPHELLGLGDLIMAGLHCHPRRGDSALRARPIYFRWYPFHSMIANWKWWRAPVRLR